jgi:hypothetical protein
MRGVPVPTRVAVAALVVFALLVGSLIGYRIGSGGLRPLDSSSISAASALVALLFSLFVYFQTRSLQRPFERPIIAIVGFGVIQPRSAAHLLVRLEARNIGNHAAIDIRTRVGYALSNAPQRFQALFDDSFVNQVEPQHGFFWQESFQQYLTADAYLYVLITYQDALTSKAYHYEYWSNYSVKEGAIWHSFVSDKQRLEQYVRAVYPLPRG